MINFLVENLRKPIVNYFPYYYAFFDYFYGYRVCRRLRIAPSNDNIELYEYSKKAFASFGEIKYQRHIEVPINLLSAIPDMDFSSLLCIGPRFTAELILAEAGGFERKGIKAIDLFSFSNRIEVGDMHHMPYKSDSFSNVLAARLLAYSKTPEKAAQEFIRVLKPGGYIYLSGDSTFKLVDYDSFFPGCRRIFGIDNVSLYSSRYPQLQDGSNANCTIVIYKKDES